MATTVAQLQVEVADLRGEVAILRAELDIAANHLNTMLDALTAQVAALEARPAKPASPKREDEAKVFPSPKEAMAACKEAVARRDGRRYWVVGDTLWNAAR